MEVDATPVELIKVDVCGIKVYSNVRLKVHLYLQPTCDKLGYVNEYDEINFKTNQFT